MKEHFALYWPGTTYPAVFLDLISPYHVI